MHDYPPHSKVWIYQSDKSISNQEVEFILNQSKAFIAEWTTHGKLMKAFLEVRYNRFLILVVDETKATASGCGIDKSIHFFQQIERELNINLMNRLLVAYKENDEVKTCSLSSFEKKIVAGEVTPETIVFNNLVATLAEFESSWEIPVKKSWHNKMLA